MQFSKFPSIENFYNVNIEKSMYDVKGGFIVTEKIDGCNFSLYIEKNTFRYAKRNGFAEEGFYNIGAYIAQLNPLIEYVQGTLSENDGVILYGEFFGRQILTRVGYPIVGFRFYAMKNGSLEKQEWASFKDFQAFMAPFKELIVPIIGVYDTLKECLAINPVFRSFLIPDGEMEKNYEAEGYVITPYSVPAFIEGGLSLYIKVKNEKFFERKHKSVEDVISGLLTDEEEIFVKSLQEIYLSYFNENRVMSLLSKEGNAEISKIDMLVRMLIADAKEDFIKEYPVFNDLPPRQQRKVMRVGNVPFTLIKKFC